MDAGLVFQNIQDHSLTNVNYQQPVQLLSTSVPIPVVQQTVVQQSVVQQSVMQQSEVNIVNNTTIYRTPSLGAGEIVKAPPRSSALVGPPSLKQGALHMCAMVGLDVSEKPPWEVVGRRELMPAGQQVVSEMDFTRMPRGGDVIISVDGIVIASVESSAEVRDMLTGDSGQVKTVVVSRLGKIMEFRLICNCSYPAIQFLRGPPYVVAAGTTCNPKPILKPPTSLPKLPHVPTDIARASYFLVFRLRGREGVCLCVFVSIFVTG